MNFKHPVHALCALQCAHAAHQWLSVHAINICCKYVNMGINSAFLKLTNTMVCIKKMLGVPCARSVCSPSTLEAECARYEYMS